jgi:hypothetical protein
MQALADLKASIEKHGILQPVLVRQSVDGVLLLTSKRFGSSITPSTASLSCYLLRLTWLYFRFFKSTVVKYKFYNPVRLTTTLWNPFFLSSASHQNPPDAYVHQN